MENLSVEDALMKLLKFIEENVALVFQKHADFRDEDFVNNPEGRFRSNNKIPRQIRSLMRNKSNLNKALLRCKTVHRFHNLKGKLDLIERQLQSSYEKRRADQESKAI